MQLYKQLVQKSIEKYQEGKLKGEDFFELYYFAYGLSYAFLKHKKQIEFKEVHFELRNLVFKTLFGELVSLASRFNQDVMKTEYEKLSSTLKRDFLALIDSDNVIIAKFLDETAYLTTSSESYGVVFFPDDTLGVIESNYPY